MSEPVLVSLIIPIYNVEKFIERCLVSAFQQNFVKMEIILVDDCATDCSMEIAEVVIAQFAERKVKIIHHEKNQGIAAVKNSALKIASGDFVIFLDGDDYIESDMVKKMYEWAIRENAEVVVADYYINYPTRQVYCKQETYSSGKVCAKQILTGKLHASNSNKLIKRSLYIEHGISFTEGVDMWEDLSVMPRLCFFAKKVAYLPEAFLHYVQYNPTSYTSNMRKKSIENIRQVIEILEMFFEKQGVGEEFKEVMNFRKLIAMSDFVIHARGKERRELCALYPEANTFICRHPSLSLFYKSIVWLGIHDFGRIADMSIVIYFFVKRFYLKVNK